MKLSALRYLANQWVWMLLVFGFFLISITCTPGCSASFRRSLLYIDSTTLLLKQFDAQAGFYSKASVPSRVGDIHMCWTWLWDYHRFWFSC
jgi:hypothetical protein